MIRIVPREEASRARAIATGIGAALLALALAAIPIKAAGADVGEAFRLMFSGALGTRFALGETVTRATPLILTGLAGAIAFRARLWNIGLEGQLYAGALAAAALGTGAVDLPAPLLLPLVVLGGASAGAVLMLGPAALKVRFGADEVVTTLLLNFVVLLFVQMMLEGPLKDPMGMGWPQSPPMTDAATLPKLVPRTRVHAGLLVGLAAAIVLQIVVARTTFGFRLRAVGYNPSAARHAGIGVGRTLLLVAAISGALAGLAGVGEVAGLKGYLTSDLSPGFGYAGVVVAMLAGLSPLGVVLASLFVAGVFVGADSMSRALGVSSFLADLIVAMSLLAVLVGGFLSRWRFVHARGPEVRPGPA